MKKFLTTIVFVGLSTLYVFSRTTGAAPATVTTAPPQPTSTPMPMMPMMGAYRNGVYTGNIADALYGLVQVQATIQNSRIADIAFLSYPNDRETSRYINGQAMPLLIQETIKAQSAKVDIISGATETSIAFKESLENALAKATR